MSNRFGRPAGAKPSPAPQAAAAPAAQRRRYKGAASIEVGMDANYMRPGSYLLMVERVDHGVTKMKNEPFTAVKMRVLASSDETLSAVDREFGRGINKPGETVSWFSKESGEASLYFEKNMLQFAMVAWNMTQEEIVALEAEEAKKNPDFSFIDAIKAGDGLLGVVVEASATMRQNAASRKAGEAPTEENVNTFPKWVRRLPFAEVKELVDASVLAEIIPDIDAKIEEESKA